MRAGPGRSLPAASAPASATASRASAIPSTPASTIASVVASIAAVSLALALGGCGGPRALTQAEVGGALVTAAEAGLVGWSTGPIGEVAPAAGDEGLAALLQQAAGLSEPCRTALAAFGGGFGTPSAYASRSFHRTTDSTPGATPDRDAAPPDGPAQDASGLDAAGLDVVVAVRSYNGDAPPLPDAAAALRTCPSFEISAGGQRLAGRLRTPAYDLPDATALGLDLTSGPERTSLDIVRARRGANLVTASATGPAQAATAAALRPVVRAQADKVAALTK